MRLLAIAIASIACGAPPRATPVAPASPAPASTHGQPDPALEYGAPLAPGCTGPHIAFAAGMTCRCAGSHPEPDGSPDLRAGITCAHVFYDRSLDGLVTARLEVPAVAPGAEVQLHLVITNTSPAPLALVLKPSRQAFVEVRGAHDRDLSHGPCGSGYSTSGTDYLVAPSAGGEVSLPIDWHAGIVDECSHVDTPLAPGRYRLILRAHLVRDLPAIFDTVETTVEVT